MHGIIIIGENEFNKLEHGVSEQIKEDPSSINIDSISSSELLKMDLNNTPYKNKFEPQNQNLSSIIRGYKSSVTTQIRKLGDSTFQWQSRFHDHIIRNHESYLAIENYIINNPRNWHKDKYFKG